MPEHSTHRTHPSWPCHMSPLLLAPMFTPHSHQNSGMPFLLFFFPQWQISLTFQVTAQISFLFLEHPTSFLQTLPRSISSFSFSPYCVSPKYVAAAEYVLKGFRVWRPRLSFETLGKRLNWSVAQFSVSDLQQCPLIVTTNFWSIIIVGDNPSGDC